MSFSAQRKVVNVILSSKVQGIAFGGHIPLPTSIIFHASISFIPFSFTPARELVCFVCLWVWVYGIELVDLKVHVVIGLCSHDSFV